MSLSVSTFHSLPSLQARYRPRGTGAWMVVASALGLVGSVLLPLTNGSASLSTVVEDAWLVPLAWLVLVALSIGGLVGGRVVPAATAVVASAFVLGEVVAVATTLAPILRRPFDRAADISFGTAWADDAQAIIGLTLVLVGGIAALAWVVRFVAADLRASGRVDRSPYRIEVLVLIAVMAIATALGALGSTEGTISALVTALPLATVLVLLLRQPGSTSMGVALGLALAAFLLALIGAAVGSDQFRPGLLVSPESEVGTFVSAAVALLLIVVIVLWNLGVPEVEAASTASAPGDTLDPWAGAAFILAFIPLLSIPAVILGHLSYERLRRSEHLGRGRLVAGAAIVVGLANVFAIVLVWTGLAAASAALLDGLGG